MGKAVVFEYGEEEGDDPIVYGPFDSVDDARKHLERSGWVNGREAHNNVEFNTDFWQKDDRVAQVIELEDVDEL